MFTQTTIHDSAKLVKIIIDGLYIDNLSDCPKDKGIAYDDYFAKHKEMIMEYLERVFTKDFLSIRSDEFINEIIDNRLRQRYEGRSGHCGRKIYNLVEKPYNTL